MRYISRFKNSIRASSVYSLAFMLTFALAAGLTTYEEAAAQSSITLSADVISGTGYSDRDCGGCRNATRITVTATLDGRRLQDTAIDGVMIKVAPIDSSRYVANPEMATITIAANDAGTSGTGYYIDRP